MGNTIQKLALRINRYTL